MLLPVVTICSSIARLRLDQTFVRFISAHREGNDWPFINGLYRTGMTWSLLTSLILAIILWACAGLIAEHIFNKPEFTSIFSIMVWAIPLLTLLILHAKALQGLKHIAKAMFVLSASLPILVTILAIGFSITSAVQSSLLYVLSAFITLALGFYWWRQIPETKVKRRSIQSKLILSSSIPLLFVIILNETVNWSSQIFLGAWSSSADIAVFNAAQRTAMLTSFVLMAVNSISAPKFSTMYHLGQLDALDRVVRNTTRLMMIFSLPILLTLLLIPEHILDLFGDEFSRGYVSLMILAIAQFINVSTGSVEFLLAMTGHEKILRNNTFIAAIISLFLGIVLIPTYGIIGASISTGIAIVCANLLSVAQARRVLNINTMAIWKK